jgi:hypothetical protein
MKYRGVFVLNASIFMQTGYSLLDFYNQNILFFFAQRYSLYLKFRFSFFVMIIEFVGSYVGTHGWAFLQKPNFKV